MIFKWETEDIFLENCKNFNACENVEKLILRVNLAMILRNKIFSLQWPVKTRYANFFEFETLGLDDKMLS